jgi:hypothetical protein
MDGDAIDAALQRMKAQREWDRVNPDNPVCPGCSRRDTSDDLSLGVCAECQDTARHLATGCRFGKTPCCGNEDCRLPLEPSEDATVLLEWYRENVDKVDWGN